MSRHPSSRGRLLAEERYLSPIILQSLGAVLVVVCVVFWMVTDRQSALLMSAALTLVGAGGLQGIRLRARDDRALELELIRAEAATVRRDQREDAS
jgi:hypothetical protein